jgi:HAD superfamily hydrolase (TIGR01509 family)
MQKGRLSRIMHQYDARLQASYGRVRAGVGPEPSRWTRFLAAVADRTGLSFTGPYALLLRTDWLIRYWINIYADVVSTLQELNQICRLGVISNAWPQMEKFLDLLGIRHYFESITISAQVGLSKPNPAIYELALRNLCISAEEAIFVDDMPYNVAAAQEMGLRALWLVRSALAEASIPTEYRGLTRIQSLDQVVALALGTQQYAPA